jgi:hypothetical protein
MAFRDARRCTHIKVTGHRCQSPALRNEYFCYFHTRMIKRVPMRRDSNIESMALLENEEAIQASLMEVINAILHNTIDYRRASLIIKALHIATRNARRACFSACSEEMVREVPNYDAQYIEEYERKYPSRPAQKKNEPALPDQVPSTSPLPLQIPTPPQLPLAPCDDKHSPAISTSSAPSAPKKDCQNCKNPGQKCKTAAAPATDSSSSASSHHPVLTATSAPARTAASSQTRANPAAPSKNALPAKTPPPATTSEPASSCTATSSSGSNRSRCNPSAQPPIAPLKSAEPPLSSRQLRQWNKLKRVEASIEGALRGNLGDLRSVFAMAGLVPRKPSRS